jgi:ubiquinone/menaquinone biosynthesis C-methylase UbiE
MGIYAEQVLPRSQDKVMDRKDTRDIRARVCADLCGEVVEVGFGTGLNAAHYPAGVNRVAAVEPSQLCMRIARPRIAATIARVELVGLTGEKLGLPSDSFDAALSTWTLCTIPNLAAALEEISRVLKPGGRFHFVEHGHSPDLKVAGWQQRIEPPWKHLAGGCHLTRRIPQAIEGAGFNLDRLDTYYQTGEPKTFGYTYEGIARKT